MNMIDAVFTRAEGQRGVDMDMARAELKITVAKLIEVAYSNDREMTVKIVRSKGPFKLTVDQSGHATLSASAGKMNFSGSPALEKIGANIKSVSVNFSNGGGSKVNYHASFDIKVAKIAFTGDFDIEELIASCSGLLCQAAKAMKGRHQMYEIELKKIMGH